MKFLHTSDLHIGKKLFELSMLEEQKHALKQILKIALEEAVDAVVIAGDVYDRAVPSAEAVSLLDDFLTGFSEAQIPVIMISGNHDCGERVAFADRILERQGIYIAGTYDGELKDVTIDDDFGTVHFICLPFVKPSVVGAHSSAEAVEKILSATPMMYSLHHRYVLVTHFFVTGDQGEEPVLSDSESIVSVGGLDNVPASMFQTFDYVALGHIHKPQRMGSGHVYYCGTPVKYSFSEGFQEKGVNIVDLTEKGQISVKRRELTPLHDMRCIKGTLSQLLAVGMEQEAGREDYLQVTLTDTEELIDPMGTLRSIYPNVLQIILAKNEIANGSEYESRLSGERKSIEELFADFYELVKGEPMDEMRRRYVKEAAEDVQEAVERSGDDRK